jgi:hypothetical protein
VVEYPSTLAYCWFYCCIAITHAVNKTKIIKTVSVGYRQEVWCFLTVTPFTPLNPYTYKCIERYFMWLNTLQHRLIVFFYCCIAITQAVNMAKKLRLFLYLTDKRFGVS